MTNPHIGSAFEDFLAEEGIRDEVETAAVKQVLSWQIDQHRRAQGLSKAALAERMSTSRTQIDRLLDPTNDRVQLDTLQRAAAVLGLKLVVTLA